MNIRDIMNLIVLSEATVITLPKEYNDVKIWKNPNHTEFFTLLDKFYELRGSIDNNGNLYVWDASVAIHSEIETFLQIDVVDRMMMKHGEINMEYDVDENVFKNQKCIKRAYGNFDFEIYNDSILDDEY